MSLTIKRIRLVDQIADVIRQMILEGKLKPGEKLVQGKLADMLNVSRTPLREAYRKLEQEGLLQVTTSGTIEVVKLDANDVLEMYDLREVIDGLAARLAAQNARPEELAALQTSLDKMKTTDHNLHVSEWASANLDFHLAVVRASHNQRLVQFAPSVRMLPQTFFPVLVFLSSSARVAQAQQEHADIFEAISHGDAEYAERAARAHIANTREMIRKEMKEGK